MARTEYYSSISPKGQITLPADIRKELGLKPKDRVAIELQDGRISIQPAVSRLRLHYQRAGKLNQPLTWHEIEEIAHEEHAERAAREGLG